MFLDSNRLTQLVELSALDRVTQGPERLGREEALAHFTHAAYGDATEAARADFMARVANIETHTCPKCKAPLHIAQTLPGQRHLPPPGHEGPRSTLARAPP